MDHRKPSGNSGPLFDSMKESEKEFKYALRACRKSTGKHQNDVMARLFCEKNINLQEILKRLMTWCAIVMRLNLYCTSQTILKLYSWQRWHIFLLIQVRAITLQNKNRDISDAGNYAPVYLANIISKLFKHYILSCTPPFLSTTDKQFGFKPQYGTDICIFCTLFCFTTKLDHDLQTVSYHVSKDM